MTAVHCSQPCRQYILFFCGDKSIAHIRDCNFFVCKYFYLKIVSTERYGRVDDVYAVACPKTPPGHKTKFEGQENTFSKVMQSLEVKKIIFEGQIRYEIMTSFYKW